MQKQTTGTQEKIDDMNTGKNRRQEHMEKKTTGTYEEIYTTGSYGKNTTGPYEKIEKRQEHMKKQSQQDHIKKNRANRIIWKKDDRNR